MTPPKYDKEKNTVTFDLQQESSDEVKTEQVTSDDDVEVDEVFDYNSAFGSFTYSTLSSLSSYTFRPSHEIEEFNDGGITFSRSSSSQSSTSSFSRTQQQARRRNWLNRLFGPSPTPQVETIMIGDWGATPSYIVDDIDMIPIELGRLPFDLRGYDGIKRIIIYCDSFAISSMRIQYTKQGELEWSERVGEKKDADRHKGELEWSERVGKRDGGDRRHEIVLDDPREYITKVKGYFEMFGRVTSLTFFTNRETYGPFGSLEDDSREGVYPFEYSGGKLVGFKGSSRKYKHISYISSIGFYVQSPPQSCEKCGGRYIISNVNHQTTREIQQIISVRQFGISESSFRTFDHGGGYDGIKRIFVDFRSNIIYRCINYLKVEYMKNGQPQLIDGIGDVYMKDSATEVVLDYPNEFLQAVTGTSFIGGVTSLTFHSNLKTTFGPFGVPFGFSFEVSGGKIIGFQGEASEYGLIAIGFHVVPTKYPISLLCDICEASDV